MATLSLTNYADARRFIGDVLRRELVGPASEDEKLNTPPHLRYAAGHIGPELDDDAVPEDETNEPDEPDISSESQADFQPGEITADRGSDSNEANSIARSRQQSLTSIGIAFCVRPGATFDATARWGEYTASGQHFVREARSEVVTLRVDGPMQLTWHPLGRARLGIVARAAGDLLICSVFLGNTTNRASHDGTDRLYQVSVTLEGRAGQMPFLSRAALSDDEASVDDLLYRKRLEYGIGLHSSVESIGEDPALGACAALKTVTVPEVERPTVVQTQFSHPDVLSMKFLATASQPEAADRLQAAFEGYRSWRRSVANSSDSLPQRYRKAVNAQLAAIDSRIDRVFRGIDFLRNEADAYAAFKFANEAMGRAQFRQQNETSGLDSKWDEAIAGKWHPFQLAFLLSVLPDVARWDAPCRDLVDVLFFPTGGGKTEAYLGVTAFVLAYRRIVGNAGHAGAGTAVILRYTLRLLTTQQFERGARLIAACELVRRKGNFERDLGVVPFSIGLWVGPMTPSRFEDARDAVEEAHRRHTECELRCELSAQEKVAPSAGKRPSHANVRILTKCPWCYAATCPASVVADRDAKKLTTHCLNADCPFSSVLAPLPLWFVDSDVYRECPSLLISTVDKFATLPYRGEAKSLFGLTAGYCTVCGFIAEGEPHKRKCDGSFYPGRVAGIDVVVQDELHTITDTIGSAYGFYETAFEYLMERAGRLPKYVCATATVKDVEKQVDRLYGGRKSAVFPPTGIEIGDTYFSAEVAATEEVPGRIYMGVYAPTRSRLGTFVSVLSALFAGGSGATQAFGTDASDPYMTVLGYFNTIRDLGGVKNLVSDDVPPVVRSICERNGWPARSVDRWELELTGRIEAEEVAGRLKLLETPYASDGADFVAATNMISVGVDVNRLGLMVVDGQPKTTAEYIQASSRVGRQRPGLVIVVYNAMRPRDVSHYEHFLTYHLSYYRFVEAGSITPFSDGCIERFAAGGYVAAYRLGDRDSTQDAADRFKTDESGQREVIARFFEDRAAMQGVHEAKSIRARSDRITSVWSTDARPLRYSTIPSRYDKPGKQPPKMAVIAPPGSNEDIALFEAPLSMRNVESKITLKVTTND